MGHIFAANLVHDRDEGVDGCRGRHRPRWSTLNVDIDVPELAVFYHVQFGVVISTRDRTHGIHAHVDLHSLRRLSGKPDGSTYYPQSRRIQRRRGWGHRWPLCPSAIAVMFADLAGLASHKSGQQNAACHHGS